VSLLSGCLPLQINFKKKSGCSERFRCKAREEPAGEAYIAIRRTGRFARATPQMSLYQQPVMTMDMEYAHLDGYYGLKIYNAVYQDEKIIHYWTPLHGRFFKGKRDGNTYYHNEDHPLASANIDALSKSAFKNIKPMIKEHGLPGLYFTDAVDDDGNTKMSQGIPMSVKATPCIVPNSETKRYEQWEKQLQYTELAVLADPLKLLPLFHYDPRRWQAYGLGGNTQPFKYVHFGADEAIYLGFKMYTAQGFRPADFQRLPILKDFYRRCVVGNIPIINHCTPQGAPTFDKKQYLKFHHPMDNDHDIKIKQDKSRAIIGLKPGVYSNPNEYFEKEFISPEAWNKVLESKVGNTRFDTLRICLAHFGGGTHLGLKWCDQIIRLMKDFDNVYADLSSSLTNDAFKDHFKRVVCTDPEFKTRIRHRILFGSDWYLTLLDGKDYLTYVTEAKTFLDEIHWSLWTRFTMLNQYEFFLLHERIELIARSMIRRRQKMAEKGIVDEELRKGLRKLEKEQIETIHKEAGHIRVAYRPLKTIENSQRKKKPGDGK